MAKNLVPIISPMTRGTSALDATIKLRQWKELKQYLSKWYHAPDMDAVKIVLSTYVAHWNLQSDPVWLFVIGTAGSGKTSVATRAVEFLPQTFKIDDLSPNSFSSGIKGAGLLSWLEDKYNNHGVMLFGDFTSILNKAPQHRNEIIGQMRRIYDGTFTKKRGNSPEPIPWNGKLTVLANSTPALERFWKVQASLGERFLYVRWRSGHGLTTGLQAAEQAGSEAEILEGFQKLILAYVQPEIPYLNVRPKVEPSTIRMAWLVARLRTHVDREQVGWHRHIQEIDEPEMPTRISKCLTMIARASAALDHRLQFNDHDLALVRRVALDSIPSGRAKILKAILDDINYERTTKELEEITEIPKLTFERTLEDLIALKIITKKEGADYTWITATHEIQEDWEHTFLVEEKPQEMQDVS